MNGEVDLGLDPEVRVYPGRSFDTWYVGFTIEVKGFRVGFDLTLSCAEAVLEKLNEVVGLVREKGGV